MKFSQLTIAAALAFSASLASAASPTVGGASSFLIADNIVLSATPQLFTFDAIDGPLSLTLTADSSISVTSFDLYDVYDLSTPLTYTAPVVAPDSVTFTFSGISVGTYAVSLTGSGIASVYGSVNVAAVPEPETYGLALAGLLVAGATLRRRAQAA